MSCYHERRRPAVSSLALFFWMTVFGIYLLLSSFPSLS